MSLIYSTLESKSTFNSEYLGEQMYNLLDQTFEFPINGFSFNVLSVSDEYIARPDLISLDAYGTTIYGDLICKINGISNPFELNTGMEIVIPSPEYINSFVVSPGEYDIEDVNFNKPVALAKTYSKRSANEAVIGDKRFKIDSVNGIIIY